MSLLWAGIRIMIKRENKGGVRQFGAKYITGGNPVW